MMNGMARHQPQAHRVAARDCGAEWLDDGLLEQSENIARTLEVLLLVSLLAAGRNYTPPSPPFHGTEPSCLRAPTSSWSNVANPCRSTRPRAGENRAALTAMNPRLAVLESATRGTPKHPTVVRRSEFRLTSVMSSRLRPLMQISGLGA